jgi:hypothetical protein
LKDGRAEHRKFGGKGPGKTTYISEIANRNPTNSRFLLREMVR